MKLQHILLVPALLLAGASHAQAQSQAPVGGSAPAQTAAPAPTPTGPESERFNVTVPEGACRVSWKVWDSDLFDNDLLSEGSVEVPKEPKGDRPLEIDPKLKCQGNEVVGSSGSSGESVAEVFVEVTIHYPGGATDTFYVPGSGTRSVACK